MMLFRWFGCSFLLLLVSIIMISSCSSKERYEPTWESLAKHQTPQWFKDAKFGIFIHWGVYSVPAWAPKDRYAEWYPHRMYQKGSLTYEHHQKKYGDQSKFGYKNFIPMFKAENWDPEAWAQLFKKAGARYVVPVAEHHDGFAMWDSELTEWDAMGMGPRRDIIGELGEAVRKYGMMYGPSYHRARLWYYYPYDKEYDTSDPSNSGLYLKSHRSTGKGWPNPDTENPSKEFLDDWKERWEEYRDKYQPDIMWFDGMWGLDSAFLEYDKQIMADYYNKAVEWGKDVGINNKGGRFRKLGLMPTEVGDWIEGDYMIQDRILERQWQNPRGIGRSYGYNQNEKPEDYATTNQLVDELVDIVSKNGNMLLNIGPKADGTIPEVQKDRLLGIGRWLEVNGEAIYETRPWRTYGEENIRFTSKSDNILYAILLEWPGEYILISSLSDINISDIRSISMLGIQNTLEWELLPEGLKILIPISKPCKHAYTLKIVTQ